VKHEIRTRSERGTNRGRGRGGEFRGRGANTRGGDRPRGGRIYDMSQKHQENDSDSEPGFEQHEIDFMDRMVKDHRAQLKGLVNVRYFYFINHFLRTFKSKTNAFSLTLTRTKLLIGCVSSHIPRKSSKVSKISNGTRQSHQKQRKTKELKCWRTKNEKRKNGSRKKSNKRNANDEEKNGRSARRSVMSRPSKGESRKKQELPSVRQRKQSILLTKPRRLKRQVMSLQKRKLLQQQRVKHDNTKQKIQCQLMKQERPSLLSQDQKLLCTRERKLQHNLQLR